MSPTNPPPKKPMDGMETYNLVSDTVTGVNLRLRDNILQTIAIGVSVLIGIGIGVLVAPEWQVGALLGGFAGLVIGFFASGIFLMIFRAVQHARGRHK